MYTLYYSPGACSLAVHAVLNELAVPFELVKANPPKQSEALLKVNPRGQVPVLTDGDVVVREGAAIFLYLFEKHASPLLPTNGEKRTRAIEWLMYGNSSLHPAYGKLFWLNALGREKHQELFTSVETQIQKMWDDVEANLAHHAYVAGDSPTVGDILLTVIANWSVKLSLNHAFGKRTKALLSAIKQRPAFQKALAAEEVEYQAAA